MAAKVTRGWAKVKAKVTPLFESARPKSLISVAKADLRFLGESAKAVHLSV